MRKRVNLNTALIASLTLANAWGFAGSSSWSAPPLATQSDARLLLKRSTDGACLVRGANLTYGDCDAGSTWLLHGHPEKGWALQGAETENDPDASIRNRHSLRNEPQCLSGHWRQLKMGPCDAKHRWLLRPSSETASEWHLVWKVLFSNFGQKALCVGVAAGPRGVRGLRSSGDETSPGAERLGLTEGNCTAFKVHEPGKLSAGAAEGASWWLAGILASTPMAAPGKSSSASKDASVAASDRSGSSSSEGASAERPWWQHTKKAEQTVVAQLRRKGSRVFQALGFQGGRASYFSSYAPGGGAVTSGRGRAGGGAVSGSGRRAAPRGSPGLSTRAHSSSSTAAASTTTGGGGNSDYSSSEASVAAALAGRSSGSSSSSRSSHLRSGALPTLLREPRVDGSSSTRNGGEMWTDSRTGLALPLTLGSSFDSSESESSSSSSGSGDGSNGGEGQVLLGGGAFSKWGMPVYVVGLYAEAASPALAASLVYARATRTDTSTSGSTGALETVAGATAGTNGSGKVSEGSSSNQRESSEAKYSDSNNSGYFEAPVSSSTGDGSSDNVGLGQPGRASWLSALDPDSLRHDPAFYLALTAPAAYDRTLFLKLAMSVNPKHLQSAMMASWLMPPHHKRRILAATTLGFGGGGGGGSSDSSADAGDGTAPGSSTTPSSSDASACCERGTEIAFTWRGRTGTLELRVNGQLLYTMREEVALAEASALLRPGGSSGAGSRSSWSSSSSSAASISRASQSGGNLALDFFGSGSDSNGGSSISGSSGGSKVPHSAAAMAFAAPAADFNDLKTEMDAALKMTGAATSMASLDLSSSSGSAGSSSSYAHAPFGTSLPRALMYQYLAADELVLISPTARESFANRAAVAIGGAAAMAPFVQGALAQDAKKLAALELQAPRSTAASSAASAAQVAVADRATASSRSTVNKGRQNPTSAPAATPMAPPLWLSAVSSFDEAYELPPTAATTKKAQNNKKRTKRTVVLKDGEDADGDEDYDDENSDEPTSLAGRLLARAKTAWAMRARRRVGIMGSKGSSSSIDGKSTDKFGSSKRRSRSKGGSGHGSRSSLSSGSGSAAYDDNAGWWDVFCRWWSMCARASTVVALLTLAAHAAGWPSPVSKGGACVLSLLAWLEQSLRWLANGGARVADASLMSGPTMLRRKSSGSFDGLFYGASSKFSPRHRGRSRGSVRAAAMAAAQRNTLSPPPLALAPKANTTPSTKTPGATTTTVEGGSSTASLEVDESRVMWRSWLEWAQEQLLWLVQVVWPGGSGSGSAGGTNNNTWPAAAVPAAKRLQQWWRRVRPPFLFVGRVKRQAARLERRTSSQTPTKRRTPSSSSQTRLKSPTSPPSTPPHFSASSSMKPTSRSSSSSGKRSTAGVNTLYDRSVISLNNVSTSSVWGIENSSSRQDSQVVKNHRGRIGSATTAPQAETVERGREQGTPASSSSSSNAAAAVAPRSRSSSAVRALAARFSGGGGKGNGDSEGTRRGGGSSRSGGGMVGSSSGSSLVSLGMGGRTSSSSSNSLSPRSSVSPFLPPSSHGERSAHSSSVSNGPAKPLGASTSRPYIRPRPRSVEPAGPPPPSAGKLPIHSSSSSTAGKNVSKSPGMYSLRKSPPATATSTTPTAASTMTTQRTARASTSDVGSSSLSSYAAFVGAFAGRSSAGRVSDAANESKPPTSPLVKAQPPQTWTGATSVSPPLSKKPVPSPSSSSSSSPPLPSGSSTTSCMEKETSLRSPPVPTRGRSRVRGVPPPSPPLPTDTYSREGRSRSRSSSSRPPRPPPSEPGACDSVPTDGTKPSSAQSRGTSAKRAATPP